MFYEPDYRRVDIALEMTKDEFMSFIEGRRELYDEFYDKVVGGLKQRERELFRYIAEYRDRNIEILSSPYMLNYMLFTDQDREIVYKVTDIDKDEITNKVADLKKFIRANAKNTKAFKEAGSLPDFSNVDPFRVILILMMRHYIESRQEKKLKEICSFMAYSMYYSVFYNFFRTPPRKETMVYTMNNMSNKFRLKQFQSVDQLLQYAVEKITIAYPERFKNCTDYDIIYLIGQTKTRIRGYVFNIHKEYLANDKAKNAVFDSSDVVGEEKDIIERRSASGDVDKLAQVYTTEFFQKNINQEYVMIAAKMCNVPRNELLNALTILRDDKNRIDEVKLFYESLFYLYLNDGKSLGTVNTSRFLASMEAIYKRGNSIDKNIITVKKLMDEWLRAGSEAYRATNRLATLNNFRKAIYEYFIFSVAMKK